MKKILLIIFAISLLFTLSNCNNNPVSGNEDTPGRRDYTWTVDTLDSFNPLYRLWGSSSSDVWATTVDLIYNYNGDKWIQGNYKIPHSVYSIYGFSSKDIYLGLEDGGIWHYDGTDFKETASLTKDGHSDIVFDNMWGDSPDDIYATGAYMDENGLANNSVIAHYSDNKWTMLNTDGIKGIVEHLYKNADDSKIYVQVVKYSNTYDSTFIYEYNQGNYIQLYKTIWAKNWANISLINNEVYFILNTEIAKLVNGQFQTVLDLGGTNFYENIWGRNSKDIFIEMTDGLAHYNGNNIEYLFYFNKTRTHIYGASLFDKEVFFLVNESSTGLKLIYHGVLK